ncbi:MAG: hypothetical protein HUK14_04250 [Muribaculaceae bacterium]|nr:hypothetical protein [Muribaculaceae bacterium]
MSTVTLILYKPETPLNPNSLSVTGSEHTLTVGSSTNSLPLNGIEYTCTINNLKFEKKVYRPCELSFQLDITAIAKDSTSIDLCFAECAKIAAVLKNYGVKLQYPEAANTKNSYACLNYYIYTVKPQYSNASGSTSIRLFITAYSVDHRLSLQKTNRAFTAKKFLSEVVVQDLAANLLKDVGVPVNHSSNAKKYLQFIKSYKKTYTSKPGLIEPVMSYEDAGEIIHPYMVQYNETYYNFLARTANRCGEFMYFEDGQLNIGLNQPYYVMPTIIDYDTDDVPSGKKKSRKATITSVTLTTLADPSTPKLEPYYPKTMNNKDASVTWASSSFVEDAKVGNDDFIEIMNKGKWVDMNDDMFMPEGAGSIYTEVFAKAMNNQTIGSAIGQILTDLAIKAASCKTKTDGLNDNFDSNYWEKNVQDDKVITEDSASYMFTSNSDQWDENLKSAKVFSDDFTNELSFEFYHAILDYERQVSQEAICVETGVNYDEDVKLGKVVQVNGTKYVVVGVNGEYSFTDGEGGRSVISENYSFTAIPVKEINELSVTLNCQEITINEEGKSSSPDTPKQEPVSQIILTIPPIYEHGHICYSPMQRAIVADASDPKSYGRVRIKYPWQTDEKTDSPSPFIRVAKDCAGDHFGINFKTEKNTEVLVDYEGGNVERPFVVGMLHSFVEKPQYPSRSIKSYNGHKIVFNDPKDGSAVFWNSIGGALSTFTQLFPVGDWKLGSTNAKELKELSGGIEMSDAYGFYKIEMSTDKRQINIASPLGKIDINAFTGITINAPNGDIKICGKNVEIEATNNLNICSGTQIDKKYIPSLIGIDKETAGTQLIGGAAAALATFVGALVNLTFPDVTLIRCMVEAFIKPCNGTLRIKSYRYLMLESGADGMAKIPTIAYKAGKVPTPTKLTDKIITIPPVNLDSKPESVRNLLMKTHSYKAKAVDLIRSYNAVVTAHIELSNFLNDNKQDAIKLDNDNGAANINSILAAFRAGDTLPEDALVADPENGNDNNPIITAKTAIKTKYNESLNTLKRFNQLKNNQNLNNEQIGENDIIPNPTIENQKTIWESITGSITGWEENFKTKINDKVSDVCGNAVKIIILKDVIRTIQIHPNNTLSYNDEATTPEELIESIAYPKPADFKSKIKNMLNASMAGALESNSLVRWVEEIVHDNPFLRSWEPASHAKGQILFSDSNTCGGMTLCLKNILDGNTDNNDVTTLPGLKGKLYDFIKD